MSTSRQPFIPPDPPGFIPPDPPEPPPQPPGARRGSRPRRHAPTWLRVLSFVLLAALGLALGLAVAASLAGCSAVRPEKVCVDLVTAPAPSSGQDAAAPQSNERVRAAVAENSDAGEAGAP